MFIFSGVRVDLFLFALLFIDEAGEPSATNWMLQLSNGLRFDLANTFSSDLEDPANLLEGVRVSIADAVSQLEDLAFAIGQRLEYVVDPAPEHLARGGLRRCLLTLVLDEVSELRILRFADAIGLIG